MACKTSYELRHNFPKIADEAGFTFNMHRPRIRIDWNKIRLIDIENLVREKKFVLIEQHLNDILDCILESEFDVRILDEGVLKMFRLAQLTVEYQQFCRHYLDRSVYVLREEINSLAQELDATKKELKEKDEEIRKLKKKSRHTYKTPLPYGNDNIANLILKTLTSKSDIFHTNNPGDSIQYNKCSYCDKVFMNQLYLQSHISRRHSQIMEVPQKDVDGNTKDSVDSVDNAVNNKLREEVFELKNKLKEMEDKIKNFNKDNVAETKNHNNNSTTQQCSTATDTKQMKDVEVSTNNDLNIIDRIEEWKKEEHDKYNKELILLRNQIMETIQTLKIKDIPATHSTKNELKIIEELNITINKQGSEILALKQELIDSRLKIEKEETERRKENDAQMLEWAKRTENSTKQYELLLQKLNEVAKEAKESRAQAEAEKARVEHLEKILQNNLMNPPTISTIANDNEIPSASVEKVKDVKQKLPKKKVLANHSPQVNRQTLEKLHQKAQALLNIQSSSSSCSSDISSEENNVAQLKAEFNKQDNVLQDRRNHITKKEDKTNKAFKKKEKPSSRILQSKNSHEPKTKEKNIKRSKIETPVPNVEKFTKNGPVVTPRSPIKVLRAKITEEVNSRLITAGIDPLKNGLSKANYKKQRMKLQQNVELKTKKNSSHEKIRHSILTYLDSKLPKKVIIESQDYISPNKTSKAFRISSVLSNVKSKALSLVKSNDMNARDKRKSLNAEIAKRAMTLLNTPSDSLRSSPDSQKRHSTIVSEHNQKSEVERNPFTSPKKSKTMSTENNRKSANDSSPHSTETNDDESESDSNESVHKYYKAVVQENHTSKSIDNLIKSPARRPLSANSDYNTTSRKYGTNDDHLIRSQSATNITHVKSDVAILHSSPKKEKSDSDTSSSELIPIEESPTKGKNLNGLKQTKSVLKNASSTSSLNKKKVLFDMDAIQMKSLSASPSQSITEKSDGNEKYELGLINLDGEEWDISSIENDHLKEDTKLQISTKASPKIAELKKTIESQLARRKDTPSTAIVGGVDIISGPMLRASSMGGSNTSLGSSILDDSESIPPVVNRNSFVKPKTITCKDDSELDISEFSTEGLFNTKNENDNF